MQLLWIEHDIKHLASAINCSVNNMGYLSSPFHSTLSPLWVCLVHSLIHSFNSIYRSPALARPHAELKEVMPKPRLCPEPFLFEAHYL